MMTESVKPNPCCDSEDEFSNMCNMCIPKRLNEKPCMH